MGLGEWILRAYRREIEMMRLLSPRDPRYPAGGIPVVPTKRMLEAERLGRRKWASLSKTQRERYAGQLRRRYGDTLAVRVLNLARDNPQRAPNQLLRMIIQSETKGRLT